MSDHQPIQVRPLSPDRLADELADRITTGQGDSWCRVGIDGPFGALPGRLADALVEPIRTGLPATGQGNAERAARSNAQRARRGEAQRARRGGAQRVTRDDTERTARALETPDHRATVPSGPSLSDPSGGGPVRTSPIRGRQARGGRAAIRVDLADFQRPASVRLERGREDPDAYYEGWYDLGALSREVLRPLAPGGTGRIVTTFWDPVTDRSTRPSYVDIPAGAVLLLSGPLLLGAGLDLDLTIHCAQSPAALARRMPPQWAWTLPAFERYAREVTPAALADIVIRMDDPDHPALVEE